MIEKKEDEISEIDKLLYFIDKLEKNSDDEEKTKKYFELKKKLIYKKENIFLNENKNA